jgi:hypothetical protein
MLALASIDGDQLAAISGGAQRSWGGVARDYTLACAEGALQATLMTGGTIAPYTLGAGCFAGVAGQGLADGIEAYRNRRRAT